MALSITGPGRSFCSISFRAHNHGNIPFYLVSNSENENSKSLQIYLLLAFSNTSSLTCRESRWGAAWCYQWRVRDLCLSAGPAAAHPRRVPASTSQCQTQPDAIHTYGQINKSVIFPTVNFWHQSIFYNSGGGQSIIDICFVPTLFIRERMTYDSEEKS
jgi:hypothetical protein